jgi:hypothetical protein
VAMSLAPPVLHNEGNGAFQNQLAPLERVRDAKYRTRPIEWHRPL